MRLFDIHVAQYALNSHDNILTTVLALSILSVKMDTVQQGGKSMLEKNFGIG